MAIKMAADMFDYGSQIGYKFNFLDVGGGFLGDSKSKKAFLSVTSAIKTALETHFSLEAYPGLKVISEPGIHF